MCDKNIYATDAFTELDENYFDITTEPEKIAEKQAKAVSLVAQIEKKMYEMLSYTEKYNKAGKEAATSSLADTKLVMDYSVDTFLNTYGYSQVFNANYIDLKRKIGKVIITQLPTVVAN